MSEPFLGEIKLISWNFAPRGWAFCNGQSLAIAQNQALFSILGTTYGGNGTTTFLLPDFRSRVPIYQGNGFSLGQKVGEEAHTLLEGEMPSHTHTLQANSAPGNTPVPNNNFLANISTFAYGAPTAPVPLSPSTVANAGGGQAHENRQPFLVLNFIIALVGLFPSRN